MADGTNSGLAHGTSGSPQLSNDNYDAKIQALKNEENIVTQNLIEELEKQNIKFNKEEMLFITKDKSGQIIWLESGNENKGLKHILDRHEAHFKSKVGINSSDIPLFLSDVIQNGTVEYSRLTDKDGRKGLEKLYYYKDTYYVLTGVGTNGFLVSAYPIKEKAAIKLKEKYKK